MPFESECTSQMFLFLKVDLKSPWGLHGWSPAVQEPSMGDYTVQRVIGEGSFGSCSRKAVISCLQ